MYEDALQRPTRATNVIDFDTLDRPVSALGAGFDPGAPGRDLFTIRDLTKEFEVSARTLRFYEEKGLLDPTRRG
jgi:hypothetical protein